MNSSNEKYERDRGGEPAPAGVDVRMISVLTCKANPLNDEQTMGNDGINTKFCPRSKSLFNFFSGLNAEQKTEKKTYETINAGGTERPQNLGRPA
jgi:hypothetical protein